MLSDDNQNTDRKHNQELNNGYAVYIVGCLAHVGAIKFDASAPQWEADALLDAIRVVKACLDQLNEHKGMDMPPLPFKWYPDK